MSSLRAQIKRFRIILIVLVAIIAVLVVMVISSRNTAAVLPAQSIEKIQTRTVEQIVSVDGNLAGSEERYIYAPSSAKLTSLDVVVGQHVNADALIGKYEVTVSNITRSFNLNTAISGVVTDVNYNLNDIITNPSQPVFHIVNTDSFVISLNINENDMANLKKDQTAKITIPALSLDDKYNGKVSFIAPSANGTSGAVTYLVKVTPDSLPAAARPGMSASVDITTARVDNVLAVPASFVIDRDSKEYVKLITWTDTDHTAYTLSEMEVTTGLKTDQYVEIKSGVKTGDEILEPSFTVVRKSLFGQ